MFVNESVADPVHTTVALSAAAGLDGGVMLDLLNDDVSVVKTSCGKLQLDLAPYQSVIVVFDREAYAIFGLDEKKAWTPAGTADLTFRIETAPYTDMAAYTVFADSVKSDALPNITDIRRDPSFSGRIRYTCTFDAPEGVTGIDLGTVGQTSHLWLNGTDLGVRVCPPYRYDLTSALREGTNELVIEVSNTLAGAIRDGFSGYLAIPASGLTGAPEWLK
jgi:hypothetical protein